MSDNQIYQMEAMQLLGIDTEKRGYEKSVSDLIYMCLRLQKQIGADNKETFKQELKRILKPSN